MQSYEIIFELKKVRLSQADVARALNVSHTLVNNVIHNRRTCHRVAVFIAVKINKPIESIWPDRYRFKPREKRAERAASAAAA